MRSQGKLTSWNDERGFGFISPDDDNRQVFVHINSFSNRGRRPELNQAVSYALSLDNKGRPCAVAVLFLGEKRSGGIFSYLIAIIFLSALAISVFHFNKLPRLIFGLYLVSSFFTFILYKKDKSAARKGTWRTSENTLHFFSLIGGWPGAFIAQQVLRHKSKKQSFRLVFWVTVLLNLGLLAWMFTRDGHLEVQYWLDVKLKFWLNNIPTLFFKTS
jgi:uncharacterized membrane protein YsdA (DUF1294 family)/cold shock CspA family protein